MSKTLLKRQLEYVEDYNNGLAVIQISQKYKADTDTISKYLKAHGIQVKRRYWAKSSKNGRSDIEFFNESYVINKTSNCWEWQGNKTTRGYGQFWYDGDTKGAHRFSYLRFKGEIKNGLYVLHTCDNPSCVNPEHLFLGTPKQNMIDKITKNRQCSFKAANAHLTKMSKLSKEQKIKLINRKQSGERICDLAKELNMSYDNLVMFFKRTHLTS